MRNGMNHRGHRGHRVRQRNIPFINDFNSVYSVCRPSFLNEFKEDGTTPHDSYLNHAKGVNSVVKEVGREG